MEVARLTTVADWDGRDLTRGLQQGAAAGGVFAQAMIGALASVGAAAVKVGLVMDDALDGIRIRTGQTGAALEGLGDSFRDVFRAGPDAAQDVSDALSTLRSRTGQTGDSLEALATQVLTLSRTTKTDLNSNVADSARLFTSWGIAASEQGDTLDLLFRTYQQTGVSIDALLSKMVTAGPTFRAAGFDFATSAALLGGFEQAGVSAERVISGMRRAFNFFSNEGINAQKGVQQTIARIQELGPSAEAGALGVKVFGRGAVDMVAAIQSGRLNVDALVASIEGGTDTIAAAAQATDGFTENLSILGKRAFLALEPLGTRILETFNRGLLAVLEPSRGLTDALHLMGKAAVVVASAMVGRMVPALALLARGYIAATAAVIANTVALLRNATAAGVLSGAVGVLRGALAFFGGPWGFAVTAALTAVGVGFLNAGRRAREAAAEARKAADDFAAALGRMDEATFAATAAAQRAAFRDIGGITTRATERLERQRAAVEALSRQAGADRFGEQRVTPELRAAQDLLRRHEASVAALNRHWNGVAANVRAVREHEAALAAGRTVADPPAGGPGPLGWEGDEEKGKTALELLRDRVALLSQVFDIQRRDGRSATQVGEELNGIYEQATSRLRAMGDAATLPNSALDSYRDLLGIVEQLRATGAVGVTLRSVPQVANGRGFSAPFANAERTIEASGAQAEYWATERERQGERRMALGDEMSAIERLRSGISRFGDAARAVQETAARAREQWSSLADLLPKQITSFADAFSAQRDKRFAQVQAGGQATGLPPVAAGAGMLVAMEFLTGVASSLGPALEALLLPIRILGEVFGRALVPVVRALFPVFRAVAIAATYVGEAFFRSTAAIQIAVGGLLRGIGRLLNELPGSLGNPLVRLGQSLVDVGRGFQEGANELARARDELRGLTFDDAAERVNDSANRLAESLSNVPPLFDLALRRMQAGRATAGVGGPAPAPPPAPPLPPAGGGGAGGGSQPVNVVIQPGAFVFQVDGRSAATDRELARMLEGHFERKLSSGVNPLTNAVKRAYEAR